MKENILKEIKSHIKRLIFDILMYITNYIVARVPFREIRLFFYNHCFNLRIGQGSNILMDAWFDTWKNFSMGQNSIILQKCHLDNRGSITIGNSVAISSQVVILTGDHDLQSSNLEGRMRPVVIEDYVFVGTRATILPGVTLGKGCAVAAGAVVTKSVEPFTIVAGIPAKPIGHRFKDLDYSASYPRSFF